MSRKSEEEIQAIMEEYRDAPMVKIPIKYIPLCRPSKTSLPLSVFQSR